MNEQNVEHFDLPHGFVTNCIFQLLQHFNYEMASKWKMLYAEPLDQSVKGQIISANRFWREQLAHLPVNTIDERECLIDHILLEDWLRLFESNVLPTAIRWNLPQQHVASERADGKPVWSQILDWSPTYGQ